MDARQCKATPRANPRYAGEAEYPPPGKIYICSLSVLKTVRARTKFAQGWPKSRAKFRPLVGILTQKAGPSREIWANPVKITFPRPAAPLHVSPPGRCNPPIASNDCTNPPIVGAPIAAPIDAVGAQAVVRVSHERGSAKVAQLPRDSRP